MEHSPLRSGALSLAIAAAATAVYAQPAQQQPATPGATPPDKPPETSTPPPVTAQPEQPPAALRAVQSKWSATLFGFAALDMIADSTESFDDVAGNLVLKKPGTWGGSHRRFMMGVRNSRLGFQFSTPKFHGISASGQLEADFRGNQPPEISEAGFWLNPAFRVRHAVGKLETPIVHVLFGQYWHLFGWQPLFNPNTVEIQGVPGEIFSRIPQLRVSRTLESGSFGLEAAVAASRPAQRDSGTPDGSAGLRLFLKPWTGVHTAGSTGTKYDPLSIAASGILRHFEVPDPAASGADVAQRSQTATGWGISVDGLIPVIPATEKDRSNGLTLTGSWVRGEGIADLYSSLTGGMRPLVLPAATAAIDAGLVGYDSAGILRPIAWRSFIVGVQYYFPKGGELWVAFNYSQLNSSNIKDLSRTPAGFFNASSPSSVFTRTRWADGNLFWDATPALRFGFEYAWTQQTFADGVIAHNNRFQLSSFYIF